MKSNCLIIMLSVLVILFGGCVRLEPVNSSVNRPIIERDPILKGEYPVRTPEANRKKKTIIGSWVSNQEQVYLSFMSNKNIEDNEQTMITKQRYIFFEDGILKNIMKIGDKETSYNGNWEYNEETQILHLATKDQTGKIIHMNHRVIW